MKLVERPEVGFDNGFVLTLKFPLTAREELEAIVDTFNDYSPETEYVLSFSKARKPRSLDANAYMWVLCDKIADKLNITKQEVYRMGIRAVGVFSDVAVQDGEPCAELISSWGSNGIGYFAELFETPLLDKDGGKMKRVRLYKGSHNYNQKELSRVIDYIVKEAKSLGIQVKSDEQIRELEAAWKE